MSPLSREERQVSTELNDRQRKREKSAAAGLVEHLKQERTGQPTARLGGGGQLLTTQFEGWEIKRSCEMCQSSRKTHQKLCGHVERAGGAKIRAWFTFFPLNEGNTAGPAGLLKTHRIY